MSSSDGELTRRQLLISGAVAAGYALAVQPVSAAITTDSTGLVAGMVTLPGGDGGFPAYRAGPQSEEKLPVVLVVHEIFGLHEYIRDVCRRLAKAGYLAVAPELYWRHGDVTKMETIERIIGSVVTKVRDDEVMSDLDGTLEWAGSDGGGDPSRSAITGFCWGGRIVWLYCAHNPELKAGAAWYGRLTGALSPENPKHPMDVAERAHAPVLGLYGADDTGIPLDTVDEMRKKLSVAGRASEIVVFPGAPHGFHADYRDSYRSMAAAEAWRRMLGWFRRHGVA